MEQNALKYANSVSFKSRPSQSSEACNQKLEEGRKITAQNCSFVECNFPNDKLFPYPYYMIGVYRNDTLPPLFYVYGGRTTIVFDLQSFNLVGVKHKGRNPKIVKHVLKHIHAWLNHTHPIFDVYTNGAHLRCVWFNQDWKMTQYGQLLSHEEWEQGMEGRTETEDELPPIIDEFDYEGYEKLCHYIENI